MTYEKLYECMLLRFMMYMMSFIIYIFNIIHNVELGYDNNYINLITYLHHVAKLHVKCKVMNY
jgi:hypothetical protein